MRFLFVSLAVAFFSISAVSAHRGELRHIDHKNSIEKEISDALKEIDASRKMIHMTVKLNDTDESGNNFFRDMEDVVSNMFNSIQHTRIPFFHEVDTPVAVKSTGKTGDKKDEVTKDVQETKNLLTRTRDELKEDIDILRARIAQMRSDFDNWMVSNEHQQFRSVLLGVLGAVSVLVMYFLISKCRRRSRLNHLSSFANDNFAAQDGHNESLLPTKNIKRPRHYPSNSDEDI